MFLVRACSVLLCIPLSYPASSISMWLRHPGQSLSALHLPGLLVSSVNLCAGVSTLVCVVLQVPAAAVSSPDTSSADFTSTELRRWLNKQEGPARSARQHYALKSEGRPATEDMQAAAQMYTPPCLKFDYICKIGDFVIVMIQCIRGREVWWVARVDGVTRISVSVKFLSESSS